MIKVAVSRCHILEYLFIFEIRYKKTIIICYKQADNQSTDNRLKAVNALA